MTATKFHLSLNVSHLGRALGFYRVLFGQAPAKCHDDYAKFELAEPPVVFSLVPQPALTGGALARVGLRLADEEAVAAVKSRLDAAGVPTQTPPDADTLAKCYVADPDLNYWEITCEPSDDAPADLPAVEVRSLPLVETGPVVWEHFVTQPAPDRAPHEDDSVDEVRLTGTFNARLDETQRGFLLKEAFRVLRPGGKLLVHGLVGDKPFAAQPQLPGLAAMVARVPVQTEPLDSLRGAGFVSVQFVKFSEKPWFVVDGIELREVKVAAVKPGVGIDDAGWFAIYRGPFREATDDQGHVFPRGQRVAICGPTHVLLRDGAAGEQFIFVEGAGTVAGCCG